MVRRFFAESTVAPVLVAAAVGIVIVYSVVMQVSSLVAERRCLDNGYHTVKTVGYSTYCSKVVNGSSMTVKVR
jgi:hypothetical protein